MNIRKDNELLKSLEDKPEYDFFICAVIAIVFAVVSVYK